jgi:hypothetical protein
MKIIDREMTVKTTITDKSNYSLYCQASFNSDGVITLRNYDVNNKNSDEIIVLSAEETQAIIKLFKEIGNIKNAPLPF